MAIMTGYSFIRMRMNVSTAGNDGGAVGRIYNAPLHRKRWLFAHVGADCISARAGPDLHCAPPNAVGRHAHMPPWPGCDDRRPWWFRRCGLGAYIMRPYTENGGCSHP